MRQCCLSFGSFQKTVNWRQHACFWPISSSEWSHDRPASRTSPDFLESSWRHDRHCCGFHQPTLPPLTSQPGRSQITFRKKPSSQVRRYRKRAEERQKARTDQASVLDLSVTARCLYLCQHHLPNAGTDTDTVGLLENNSLTVHTFGV